MARVWKSLLSGGGPVTAAVPWATGAAIADTLTDVSSQGETEDSGPLSDSLRLESPIDPPPGDLDRPDLWPSIDLGIRLERLASDQQASKTLDDDPCF